MSYEQNSILLLISFKLIYIYIYWILTLSVCAKWKFRFFLTYLKDRSLIFSTFFKAFLHKENVVVILGFWFENCEEGRNQAFLKCGCFPWVQVRVRAWKRGRMAGTRVRLWFISTYMISRPWTIIFTCLGLESFIRE